MNPFTLLRLWEPWKQDGLAPTDKGIESKHTLKISGETCLWPGAIYRARQEGYLIQVREGKYRPSKKMLTAVEKALQIKDLI